VRSLKSLSLIAVGAMLAAGTALAAGPAMADPVNNHLKTVTPKYYDIVGVGSDTDDTLFDQLAYDYDAAHKTHNKNHPYIYSFDATPPGDPLDTSSLITPKQGCGQIQRPDGSGAGEKAFWADNKSRGGRGHVCIDFGRSTSYRSASDTVQGGPGGDSFVRLAEDAETYAVNPGGPTNLTYADLQGIYSCDYSTWGDVPGVAKQYPDIASDPIVVLLPPATTGVAKFWLQTLGLSATTNCMQGTGKGSSFTLQQNEGINAIFTTSVGGKTEPNPAVIVPYSVGKYIAERYHSAKIGHKPTKRQNTFGRDEHGSLVLGSINGVAATVGSGVNTKINSELSDSQKLGAVFTRPIYDIVWYATKSTDGDHIPNNLERFFAPASHVKVKGWFCANKEALHAIEDYGFLTTQLCGLAS
jgi:ABC-type phosphate transport system substrate-binding protein